EQAEDVEHGAEAFAFLLRDPHHGAQPIAQLGQRLRNHQLFEPLEVEVRDVLGAERAQAAADADRRRSLHEPCVRDGAQLRRQQDAEQPRLGLPRGADRRLTVGIPTLARPPTGFDQPSAIRSVERSQPSPRASRKDSSMLGKASWTTPKAQEVKVDTGTWASSAQPASAPYTAGAKSSGVLRWRRSGFVDPSPRPSTSVSGVVLKRALFEEATASIRASSEVTMVAAAPQQGTA